MTGHHYQEFCFLCNTGNYAFIIISHGRAVGRGPASQAMAGPLFQFCLISLRFGNYAFIFISHGMKHSTCKRISCK